MGYLNEKKSQQAYTFVLFKKVGTYTKANGEEAPVLEPVKALSSYHASRMVAGVNSEDDTYVIKATRLDQDHFEDFADILQRRKDLETLRYLVFYSNLGEVYNADDFTPLECQLRFKWEFLLENYRSILSEDEKENEARLIVLGLLHARSSGNIPVTVQEYLDAVTDGWTSRTKEAADYLRLFESQGFIEITDSFTIRPKKVKEFYDSHFETRLKSGQW